MKGIIRLGDPTDHGGAVVSTSANQYLVDGKPVARVGDKCTCPEKGHDGCTIAEGNLLFTVDGIAVAFSGHKTTCGAVLQSTMPNFSIG